MHTLIKKEASQEKVDRSAIKVCIKMKRLSFNSQTLLNFSLSNAKEGI